MMISSFFPGRIRLRDEVLKDVEISAALQDAIQEHEAVKKIEHNLKTGSVLIEYSVLKLPVQKLTSLKEELLLLQDMCAHYSNSTKPAILAKIAELKQKLLA